MILTAYHPDLHARVLFILKSIIYNKPYLEQPTSSDFKCAYRLHASLRMLHGTSWFKGKGCEEKAACIGTIVQEQGLNRV